MRKIIVLVLVLAATGMKSQQECRLIKDSCLVPPGNKKTMVELLDTKIKNNYHIQLIHYNQQQFLKIIVTDNLGYGKTAPLLLKSGTKQMYYKSATLTVIDKGSAYFMLELYPNYEVTLKDYGLTGIVFAGDTEFAIPKQDSELIKQEARCFYSLINKN